MIIFFILLALPTFYFLFYAQFHLCLSAEEEFALFIIYSIQFIRRRQASVIAPSMRKGKKSTLPGLGDSVQPSKGKLKRKKVGPRNEKLEVKVIEAATRLHEQRED